MPFLGDMLVPWRVTSDDCNKAKQIRKHSNIKNMGVYHDDLYLQTDVLLPTVVLDNF